MMGSAELGSANATRLTVQIDLDCPGCGYNLRGVDAGGRCPECGLPVSRAMARVAITELARTAPFRRPRLAGLTLVSFFLLLALATLILIVPHLVFRAHRAFGVGSWIVNVWPAGSAAYAGALGLLAAMLLVTLRRPLLVSVDRPYHIGLCVSIAGLAGWSLALIGLGLYDALVLPDPYEPYYSGRDIAPRLFLRLIASLCLIPVVIGLQPMLRFLRRYARDQRLDQMSRSGLTAILVAVGLVVLSDVLRGVLPWLRSLLLPRAMTDALEAAAWMFLAVGAVMLALAVLHALWDSIVLLSTVRLRRYLPEDLVG